MGFLSLMATLGLNASGYETKLKQVESMTTKWSRQFQNRLAGAFTVGALTYGAKRVIDYADRIQDMSEMLSVSTTKLQQWGYAAEQSGTNLESVAIALRQITRNRDMALSDPTGRMAKAFERLGVSADQLKTLRIEQIFERIAAKAKELKDPNAFGAAAIEILGRSASDLFAMMTAGMEDLSAGMETIDPESVKALADFNDQLSVLKLRLMSLAGPGLVTGLKTIVSTAMDIAKYFEIGVGAIATFYGAKMGGASTVEAANARNDFVKEVEAKYAAAEAAAAAKEEALRNAAARGTSGDYSPLKAKSDKEKRESYASSANVDALQRIGGFAGMVNAEIKVLQRRIADATERTAKAAETTATNTDWDGEL